MSELEPDTLVELAPGFDHMYNPEPFKGKPLGAYVGCRARVTDRKEDEVGFPQVYIKWDREDWRWGGMPDGWTFENHFREVKNPEAPGSLVIPAMLQDMVKKAQEQLDAEKEEKCEHCGEVHTEEEEQDVRYMDALAQAEDKVLAGDGFLVLTVSLANDSDPEYVLFDGQTSSAVRTDEARRALEQHIIDYAAKLILRKGLL